ncbi:MAG: hypothetical protein ACFB9M_06655 [Myxococcota bacterium]
MIMGIRFAVIVLMASLSVSCATSVVHKPVNISAMAESAEGAQRIQPVKAKRCNRVILIIPIIPQPRSAIEELMEKARAVGGNAVVDFEIRTTGIGGFVPFYVQACYEAHGVAAKL